MKRILTKIGLIAAVSVGSVIAVALVIFVSACATGAIRPSGYLVNESAAVRALDTQGFRDIKVLKRNCSFVGMRGGGANDKVRFTVSAVNPAGKTVTVYVFAGWPFKGSTIRMP